MDMRAGWSFLRSCYVRRDAKIHSSKDVDKIREELTAMNKAQDTVLLGWQLIK